MLEQDSTMQGQMNKFSAPKFELGKYVEAIRDSVVYAKEAKGHLSGLYHLVVWKDYLEEDNAWEPSSTVMHLRKIVSTFYKDHSEKSIMALALLASTPPKVKLIIQLPVKQKREPPIGCAKKCTK